MSRKELGCPGHFIAVNHCRFRRHTQIGTKYRVSTVGDYFPDDRSERKPIGAGQDSFFETLVFQTVGKPAAKNEGCGCLEVKDWCESDGRRYATAGAAQAGHEAFVRKYLRRTK